LTLTINDSDYSTLQRIFDKVRNFLKHPDARVRERSAHLLRKIPDAADELSYIIQNDPDSAVRLKALYSIKNLRYHNICELLDWVMKNDRSEIVSLTAEDFLNSIC